MALRSSVRYSQYRGHERIEGPQTPAITTADLASHLRVDPSEPLLDLYAEAAIDAVEQVTGRALITQTWRLTLDHWPAGGEPWWDGVRQGAISELHGSRRAMWVILPRYRLQSVEQIAVFDDSGQSESVPVTDTFISDTQQEPGRLVLRSGASWPVALQRANAIQIDYKAGYGDDPGDVPAALRVALLQLAAHMHERRGDDCDSENAIIKSGAWPMVSRYMVQRI